MLAINRDIYSTDVLTAYPHSTGTAAEIISFRKLPKGWRYGEGGPIPEKTIIRALKWNRYLLHQEYFTKTKVSPSADGRIAIGASCGNHYVEVIIEPDGTVSVAYDFKRKQQFFVLHKFDNEAEEAVQAVVGAIWKEYIISIPETTIQTMTDFSGLHLQTIEGPFLLMTLTASSLPGLQYVNTSPNIFLNQNSQPWYGSLQSFGGSKQKVFQPKPR